MLWQPGVIRVVSARIPHQVCAKLGVRMLSEAVHERLQKLVPLPDLDDPVGSQIVAAIKSPQVVAAIRTCLMVEAQQRRDKLPMVSEESILAKLSAVKIEFVHSVW